MTLKDASQTVSERRISRFLAISLLRREQSLACIFRWPGCGRVYMSCNTSGAYHVQYAVCHVIRRDSSAIKFDRVEICMSFNFISIAETINRRRGMGRKPEYPEKTPDVQL